MSRNLFRLFLLLFALGAAGVLIFALSDPREERDPAALKQRLIDRFGPVVTETGCGPPLPQPDDPPPPRVEQFRLTPTKEGRYRFELRYRRQGAGIYQASGVITDRGSIAVSEDRPAGPRSCPICLGAETRIATPQGLVRVSELRRGDQIWTRGRDGSRQAAMVLKTTRRSFPHSFPLVRLVLEDGRRLTVSARHPTADGRQVGGLARGSLLDGSRVKTLTTVSEPAGATYDLLPSGPTGTYWADDVLLRSTLSLERSLPHPLLDP
jgi:Hint domain-containing protein